MSEVIQNTVEVQNDYSKELEVYLNLKYEGPESLDALITAKDTVFNIIIQNSLEVIAQIRDDFSNQWILLSWFQKMRMYELSAMFSNHIKTQNILSQNTEVDTNISIDTLIS